MNPSPAVVPIPLSYVQTFLLRGERPILVDTGTPRCEDRIEQTLRAAGVNLRELALILITHGHTDHFGSAAALRARSGAPVAIHAADAAALRSGRNPALPGRGLFAAVGALVTRFQPAPPSLEPDILLTGETDLAAWGVAGRVIPTPGHTPGSVSIWLESGDLLIGDLAMGGFRGPGRLGQPFIVADAAQLRTSQQAMAALAPARVWTSHGGPFSGVEYQAWVDRGK
jgi:glyoxylase-like metal-dependent hydrolase (beta-lactamase superfamily II)